VETIKGLFPATNGVPTLRIGDGSPVAISKGLKVGAVLSGGQAPGGHNVVAGLYDAVKRTGPDSVFYGFCDGPHGIFNGNVTRIDDVMMDGYRNTGGFDMIGSGRHKIETPEQFAQSVAVCTQLDLDGLIVIGGDDSNTNAALLAEHFMAKGCKTKVIGCPKTIDGDLKCPPEIPVSFGFDTACRTYAELVGNVAVDALSAQKYYHFCRLMGRSASNIALEVALLTNPNVCLLGEEVQKKNLSLKQITQDLVSMIKQRSADGKNYGVVILPEGLIEFIPEFNAMIAEINELGDGLQESDVIAKLSPENAERFQYLPGFIRAQLLLDRDPHGNVQVAKIDTEQLLASCIEEELGRLKAAGEFSGSFTAQFHAFGYEGRAGLPSRFDATYCYVLGYTAGVLLASGATGLISSVKNLAKPVVEWQCGGVPVTSLCVVERRKGKDKPVIRKALVELEGPLSQPFQAWSKIRDMLALDDHYLCPGPLQYDDACPTSLNLPVTLQLELGGNLEAIDMSKPEPQKFGKFVFCPRPLNTRSTVQKWRSESVSKAGFVYDLSKVAGFRSYTTRPPVRADGDAIRKALPSTFAQPLIELKPSEKTADKEHFEPPSRVAAAPEARSAVEMAVPPGAKVGIVFCGRQAPGGHDALFGITEALRAKGGEAWGFVGGAKGLFGGHAVPMEEVVDQYRRTGGFELLGRSADRVSTTEHGVASEDDCDKVLATCKKLGLTGLILVGGCRTATDAMYLAEHFAKKSSSTAVILLPCGIEGSLLNPFVEASLGFDSASKTIAQLVANTCTDGASARKYYYFLRCMDGSSTGLECTSHLSMEVALSVKPNMVIIGEEVADKRLTMKDIVNNIADVICARAHAGKNFGTIVIPEGLFAAIPETRVLISELAKCKAKTLEEALPFLSTFSAALLKSFPEYIQKDFMKERQSDGMVDLSKVHSAEMIGELVEVELKKRKQTSGDEHPCAQNKIYKGSFSPVMQFLGYQARTSMPSDFDAQYGRALGNTAGILAALGCNGYLASVSGLAGPVQDWRLAGAPISAICDSTDEGVRVRPTPVPIHGAAWQQWVKQRAKIAEEDLYCNPGPIQFAGPDSQRVTETLTHRASQWGEAKNYLGTIDALEAKIDLLVQACRPGCEASLARVANRTLGSMEEILALMSE